MAKILIIEDEKRVADLLSEGLHECGYETLVAYDGEMGLRLFRSSDVDAVISDVVLPGINGFELCKQIRDAGRDTPILMLTALGTADDKLEGFDAGADDYMVKPFDFRELVARLKVLTKRGHVQKTLSPVRTYADVSIDTARHTAMRNGTPLRLTPKEYNLMLYLVENAERVISRTEIAEKVWDTHFDTGTNFIDVCVNYLRKKVDAPFAKKLIHTRPGVGFILIDE